MSVEEPTLRHVMEEQVLHYIRACVVSPHGVNALSRELGEISLGFGWHGI